MKTLLLSEKHFNIQNNIVEWLIPNNKSLYELLKFNYKDTIIENGKIKLITDLNTFKSFFEIYKNIVFIEDSLDLSISISQEFFSKKERTLIGNAWYETKYKSEDANIVFLAESLIKTIQNLPLYQNPENLICAVPVSTDSSNICNFIDVILKKVSTELKLKISELEWLNKKEKIKHLVFEQKINLLKNSSLKIEGDLTNMNCVLFDDLYQSGTTINYVASKLKEKGAKNVYGITLVKNPNNFDNFKNEKGRN